MVLHKTPKEEKIREYYVHTYSSYVPSDKYYLVLEYNILRAKKIARKLAKENYKESKGRAETGDNFQFEQRYGFKIKPYNQGLHDSKENLILISKTIFNKQNP